MLTIDKYPLPNLPEKLSQQEKKKLEEKVNSLVFKGVYPFSNGGRSVGIVAGLGYSGCIGMVYAFARKMILPDVLKSPSNDINEDNFYRLIVEYLDVFFLFCTLFLTIKLADKIEQNIQHLMDEYYRYKKALEDDDRIPEYPKYENLEPYPKILKLEKTAVGNISHFLVTKIKQKVAYRDKLFEYSYLMNSYIAGNNDHTGQEYDFKQLYRMDDKNIEYI